MESRPGVEIGLPRRKNISSSEVRENGVNGLFQGGDGS